MVVLLEVGAAVASAPAGGGAACERVLSEEVEMVVFVGLAVVVEVEAWRLPPPAAAAAAAVVEEGGGPDVGRAEGPGAWEVDIADVDVVGAVDPEIGCVCAFVAADPVAVGLAAVAEFVAGVESRDDTSWCCDMYRKEA